MGGRTNTQINPKETGQWSQYTQVTGSSESINSELKETYFLSDLLKINAISHSTLSAHVTDYNAQKHGLEVWVPV